MCGKSFLFLHSSPQPLHPSVHDTDQYLTDPFISIIQDVDINIQNFLALFENRQKVFDAFGDYFERKTVLKNSIIWAGDKESERSLTKEFLDHSKSCQLQKVQKDFVIQEFYGISKLLADANEIASKL